jgi:hypothetical protein
MVSVMKHMAIQAQDQCLSSAVQGIPVPPASAVAEANLVAAEVEVTAEVERTEVVANKVATRATKVVIDMVLAVRKI